MKHENLSKQDIEILQDVAAFIHHVIEDDRPIGYVISNVGYDLSLFLDLRSPDGTYPDWFRPRTSGYSKRMRKKSRA